MQVHLGTDQLQPEWPRSVICIGTFDGVHLGHQAVIGTAVRAAREQELPAWLITFDRHPASVLAPERKPPAIATLSQNLAALQEQGLDGVVVLPFTPALSQTSAEVFLESVVRRSLHGERVVVGHDFAFGKDREGTPDWLRARIETQVVPAREVDGVRVSSRGIRQAILEGRVEEARTWLGRPFALEGLVVSGQRLGRQLGYPTANLAQAVDQVVPAHGIYAGRAHTPFGAFQAAISIGVRPTVDGGSRSIEAFLLDYPGQSLYGRTLDLEFRVRLRDEIKFGSIEDLKAQMARDVEACRGVE